MTLQQPRLGQAMKESMNNLTLNIIFPMAVMYTEWAACAYDVCVQVLLWHAPVFAVRMPYMRREVAL